MKWTMALALAAGIAGTAFAAHADQTAGPPGACGGMGGQRGRGPGFYNAKTTATWSGEVAAVEQRGGGRRGGGVHVDLKTSEGTIPVWVGPSWFLQEQGLQIAQGDGLEVTGSRVTYDGKPAVIAQVVKKGSTAVALRDIAGVPVWCDLFGFAALH